MPYAEEEEFRHKHRHNGKGTRREKRKRIRVRAEGEEVGGGGREASEVIDDNLRSDLLLRTQSLPTQPSTVGAAYAHMIVGGGRGGNGVERQGRESGREEERILTGCH
jgi:hypothetical protein